MTRTLFGAAALAATVTLACSDGTAPGTGTSVSLSFSTPVASVSPSLQPVFGMAGDTLASGGDTLVIDQVQIVLREIELELQDHSGCDTVTTGHDACEEFEAGPVLVDLPLGGAVETAVSIDIPAGTYDELKFKIHTPEDSDAAFLAAHPDFAGLTIRVTGSYNGAPFTYTSGLDAEQELPLVPALVVTDGGTATNVTLRVDVQSWFSVGGQLVNPATGNTGGANESVIKENVKNSFKAFEDDNRDGQDTDEGY